ncbi:MAG TPA: hypothetical protein VK957_13845 [Lunatimonas sp.]|nr:hypothetical protein [Lunatimonas sp.]
MVGADWGGNSPSTPMTPSNVGGVYLGGAGKTLEGLDNISGIAVDEITGRLVLLSEEREGISLPPLRLDDVVTIFSSVFLHGESPFVSIDPNPQDSNGDIMLSRHSQTTEGTHVGWILFESDRVMKAYTLGKDNETGQPLVSKVSGYQDIFDSRFSCIQGEQIWERFWIVPAEVKQSLASEGQLSLFDLKLKVNTQKMKMREGKLV